ncbi:PREDICTED: LIM/homeobox protein Lhx2-like [Thamnophis sirtalis]|uniref:LIM/homeobox protein Lhx2-like n=1 Tax=Thamnophis sirtalis TaxID=35019 RepID=A0A6I9Z392_9SAUR|nr:PREDICTED: LIM/homeobox protein Lhx2-like [Thamnophis sirtalis]
MLFHSLAGSEMQGVIDEMDRRSKGDAPAITSVIDRGETETHAMPSVSSERAALCAGCGGKISDRYYLLAVDKQWHMRCLKCCECKLNLESELTCFSKDGSIYCKEDYYRRFSVQRCARCHLGISASEMVMRARDSVYHLNCFTCSTCAKMLTTGDHFGMKDGLVYCRLHFEALLRDEYQLHFNHAEGVAGKGPALGAAAPLGLPYYNGVGTVQKGRPRKRKSPGPGAELAAYNAETGWAGAGGAGVQIPGFRNVWFQNARAKFRRNLLRQENTGVDKASDPALQAGTPSGPASEISNTSLSPSRTPTTLTDLTNPSMPSVTSVLSSVSGGLDVHESRSPSQTTLTNLF